MAHSVKSPLEMNYEELFIKLEEDGVDSKAAHTLREAEIDGKLLWLMVKDFNEFSAIVTNPVQRLHLKQFVLTYKEPNMLMTTMSESGASAKDNSITLSSDSENDSPADVGDCSPKETTITTPKSSDKGTKKITTPKSSDKGTKKRSLDSFVATPEAKRKEVVEDSLILPEKFSRRVSEAIAAGRLISDDRSAFVRECVDFLEPILPTPSKEQFNDISRRLCDKYSSLKDAKKTVYWTTLKSQLSQRYRNNRRRTPASASHKIVLPNTSSVGEPSQTSLINGHEAEEHDENVEALKKLSKMKSPAAQTVQDLLKATRKVRQEWLSSAHVSIHQIIEKYPVFGNPKWLLHEFNAIEGKDMLETMTTNWNRVCEKLKVNNSPSPYVEEKQVLQKVEKNVYHRKSASPVTIEEACGDIDDHFKSKILEPRVVIFEDDESILQMFLVAENDSLMELPAASTIGQGFVYLMAAYYVFDVNYPKPYQPLLYFIQDFIMDKTDNGKRPTRYSSFAASLSL